MRWLLYLIAAPVLFVVALAQNLQMNPAPSMPSAPISVGTAPQGADGQPVGSSTVSGVPANLWPLMQQAAAGSNCGVSATDLAAIAKTESGFGTNMSTSSAGAIGFMQFEPATWAKYGNGGDPYNPADALPAAARLLCADGYGTNRTQALNNYGGCTTPTCLGSTDYASYVSKIAQGFSPTAAPAAVTTGLSAAIDLAQQYVAAHTPYVFGGNSIAGIDCSGLVQQVFLKLGFSLPRTAAEQFTATQRVRTDQVQPGDLVFFSNTYMPGISHVGIVLDPATDTMINAPDTGQAVQVMSYAGGFWAQHLTGFGRV